MKLSLNKISPAILIMIALVIFTNGKAQTKGSVLATSDTAKVFQKVEIEASFPGGVVAWNKYVSMAIMANSKKLRKSDYGTCVIKFIVDKNGSITDYNEKKQAC